MRLIDHVPGKATATRSARTGCSLGDRDLARRRGPLPKDQITVGGRRWSPRLLWQSRVVLVAELIGLALLLSASTAHADTMVVALATSFTDILSNIQKWVMGILAGLATLFMTIGASRYMWGNNEPSEIAKAKAAVKAAGFGYCLALLVPLILEILKGFVGAQ